MIDAHRIVWRALDSLEFDVTAHCSFNSDNGTTNSFLNRDNIYTEHYDGHRTMHKSKYSEVFSPSFTLIHKDLGEFTEDENRRILSWLSGSDKPGWLEVYRDDSNVLTWQCLGNIVNIEQYKLGNGSVVGYEFNIETTHPYAFSRKFETTKQILEPTTFTLVSNSDEYAKPIYPTVTVSFKNNIYVPVNENPTLEPYKMVPNVIYKYGDLYYINIPSEPHKGLVNIGTFSPNAANVEEYYCVDGTNIVKAVASKDANGNAIKDADGNVIYAWQTVATVGAAVVIENSSANTKTTLTGAAINEKVILDGMNKVITVYNDQGRLEQRIIGDSFNWEWLSLNYGDNNITVTGNCDIAFEWLEPRKVGEL